MNIPAGIQAVADHGALSAILGQRRLAEHLAAELGEFGIDGDPSAGLLSFVSRSDARRRIDVRMQLIASIAPGPRSLLWGWAHPQTTDRSAAERLRALGEQHQLGDLTTAEVPFSTDAIGDALGADLAQLGHAVAAAAVEATGTTPYYLAPIGGGSLLVALLDGVALRPADLALDGAGLLSALEGSATTDHRAALLGFARHGGFHTHDEGTTLELTDDRGSRISASWDQQGRLANLSLRLVPPAGGSR